MRTVTVIAGTMPGIAGPVFAAHRDGEQATGDGGGAEDEQNPAEGEGHGVSLLEKPIKSGRAMPRKAARTYLVVIASRRRSNPERTPWPLDCFGRFAASQ
jgi:hypothetical protein